MGITVLNKYIFFFFSKKFYIAKLCSRLEEIIPLANMLMLFQALENNRRAVLWVQQNQDRWCVLIARGELKSEPLKYARQC